MNFENQDKLLKKLDERGYSEKSNTCFNCIFYHQRFKYDDGPTYYCMFGAKPFPTEIPPDEELGEYAKYKKEKIAEESNFDSSATK